MRHILVVEDNNEINQLITDALRQQGYIVHQAFHVMDARRIFSAESIDCIITDLMLPIISGEEFIKEIRLTSQVHIIVVTAKTTVNDKLENLKIGANDYLYKPFIPEEIVYKINNLFAKPQSSETLSFNKGMIQFEDGINQVVVNQTIVELTSVEYRMFRHLIRNANKVISRDQFLNVLYEYGDEVYDRVVDVHIKNIRQKIRPYTDQIIIKTVYGLGYTFVGDMDA